MDSGQKPQASLPKTATLLMAGQTGFCLAMTVTGATAQVVADASAQQAETVVVTGMRTGLDKIPGQILDVPQSINVVPAEVIQQQGVTNIQDALKNVPGITLNAGEGGSHGDTVNLRGFSASDDFFLDGLRDTGFYTRDTFDDESLEVLKGPASTLFGRGSTGGVINQISKTPKLDPFAIGVFTVGTGNEFRSTADVDYALDDASALRLNAIGETSAVPGRDFARYRRWGVAPSVAFGIDKPTTLTLSYLHQYENNVPDFGIPFLFGKPAPVPDKAYYGLPPDDRVISQVDVGTATLKHDFGDSFSLSDRARYGNYYFDTRQTSPIYGNANCYSGAPPWAGAPVCTGAAGQVPVTTYNPLFPIAGMPLDQIYVERDRPSASGTVRTLMNDTDATWKFETGALAHTLVFGVEADREEADIVRYANQNTLILPTPLLDPDPHEAFPGRQTGVRQRPDTATNTIGAYAVDTISWGEHWSLTAALRWDRFDATYDESVSNTHFQHTDNITSPRLALVYKPDKNSSLYLSYGTSFDPSAENLSLSSRNADLGPEKDRTYEAGGKILAFDGLLAFTGAVFDTEMTNARIADPFNPGLQALAGVLKADGAEFDVTGYITPDWEITAGYTYLNARSDGLFGPHVSGPVPNTAHNQANLWSIYEFEDGWKAGAGLNYLDARAVFKDSTGLVTHVPGYWTADAMASYQLTDHLQLQLNGYNLLNKKYFANAYFSSVVENHVVPGYRRYFTLSAIVNF